MSEVPSPPAGAPTGLAVAADGDGYIALQWQPPTGQPAYAPVTAYLAQYGGGSQTVAGASVSIGGLANGAPVTVLVYAINRAGAGVASAPLTATAATTPSAPAGFAALALPGAQTLSLRWSAPANGGASITAYWLSSLVANANTVTLSDNLGATLGAAVGGVTAGGEYGFVVVAVNRKGAGATATARISLSNFPGAPVGLFAVANTNGVAANLYWQTPNNNGSFITAYILSYNQTTATLGASPAAVAGGLRPNRAHRFTLRAFNAIGAGAAATAGVSLPPIAPFAPFVFAGGGGRIRRNPAMASARHNRRH